MKTITELAELSGTTIPTLRHYDDIGLLKPLARSGSGIRLYGQKELIRLREILVWRQLGFPLSDVAALVDDPGHNRLQALRRQLQLVCEQRDRFGAVANGLEAAIEAAEEGRSIVDDDIFREFDVSLSTDEPLPRSITARLRLVDGPGRLGSSPDPDGIFRPRRIVVTEPIRLGESLLALGIVPAGAGSFADFSTDQPNLYCPWPELVEAPIRDRVQSVGYYGGDRDLIAAARPDLILDLLLMDTGETTAERASWGQFSRDDLREIAPTVLFQTPIEPPAFLGRIEQVAAALLVEDRTQSLRASWHARATALREHVAGHPVSALNTSTFRIEEGSNVTCIGRAATPTHEGQIFGALGLELIYPVEGQPTPWTGVIDVTDENIADLSAPTLFLTVDNPAFAGPVHRLAARGRLADLSAVRSGRVFDYRWRHMRSGWFTAHWQLQVVAQAFGVARLRTVGLDAPVHLAIGREGKAVAVSTVECGVSALNGPGIPEIRMNLQAGIAASVDLDDVGCDICAYPEGYSLTTERSGTRRLEFDRESCLERLTQQHLAA